MKNDYFETGCIKASCFDANAQPTLFQVPAIAAPTCNSTENGLLKIRCGGVACSLYEPCKPIDEPLCK